MILDVVNAFEDIFHEKSKPSFDAGQTENLLRIDKIPTAFKSLSVS